MNIKELQANLKEGWIQVKFIIPIVGSPKEHIEYTLNLVKDKLLKEEGIKEISTKVNKPQKLPDSEKMFSGFLEFELLVTDFSKLMGIIYDYLPSSIEIIAPEKIEEDTLKLTEILNDLANNLHRYSESILRLTAEKTLLARQIPDEQGASSKNSTK